MSNIEPKKPCIPLHSYKKKFQSGLFKDTALIEIQVINTDVFGWAEVQINARAHGKKATIYLDCFYEDEKYMLKRILNEYHKFDIENEVLNRLEEELRP